MTPGPGIFRTELPEGFHAGGVNAGVRRYRPDIGLITSTSPCVAVGVFTQNTCAATPVQYCQNLLPANNIKAIFTNSGQANAATGEQGVIDNQTMVDAVATALDCQSEQVLIASTGVIGEPVAVDKITQSIPKLVGSVSTIAEKFATAILTTDLVPKTVMKKLPLKGGVVTITGICKGSGMIHPNMATMLGYILMDVQLTTSQAQKILSTSNEKSFNMISVDGETSTNDSAFLLANGASHVSIADEEDFALLQSAVDDVMVVLAKSIARDGEGATKLLEVNIKNSADLSLAKQVARSITVSPLIKSAVNGASPNWGRVISRLGQEAVEESILNSTLLYFQGCLVYAHGKPIFEDSDKLEKLMKQDTITITIDFQSGDASATAWGCDLSEKYVEINGDYLS